MPKNSEMHNPPHRFGVIFLPPKGRTKCNTSRCYSCRAMVYHPDKCKELLIDFKRTQHQFDVITVNSKELERVNSVKLLGVTIASTLQWNCHISDVLKKANKRMFFLK